MVSMLSVLQISDTSSLDLLLSNGNIDAVTPLATSPHCGGGVLYSVDCGLLNTNCVGTVYYSTTSFNNIL
jgi:hypothetical protein